MMLGSRFGLSASGSQRGICTDDPTALYDSGEPRGFNQEEAPAVKSARHEAQRF